MPGPTEYPHPDLTLPESRRLSAPEVAQRLRQLEVNSNEQFKQPFILFENIHPEGWEQVLPLLRLSNTYAAQGENAVDISLSAVVGRCYGQDYNYPQVLSYLQTQFPESDISQGKIKRLRGWALWAMRTWMEQTPSDRGTVFDEYRQLAQKYLPDQDPIRWWETSLAKLYQPDESTVAVITALYHLPKTIASTPLLSYELSRQPQIARILTGLHQGRDLGEIAETEAGISISENARMAVRKIMTGVETTQLYIPYVSAEQMLHAFTENRFWDQDQTPELWQNSVSDLFLGHCRLLITEGRRVTGRSAGMYRIEEAQMMIDEYIRSIRLTYCIAQAESLPKADAEVFVAQFRTSYKNPDWSDRIAQFIREHPDTMIQTFRSIVRLGSQEAIDAYLTVWASTYGKLPWNKQALHSAYSGLFRLIMNTSLYCRVPEDADWRVLTNPITENSGMTIRHLRTIMGKEHIWFSADDIVSLLRRYTPWISEGYLNTQLVQQYAGSAAAAVSTQSQEANRRLPDGSVQYSHAVVGLLLTQLTPDMQITHRSHRKNGTVILPASESEVAVDEAQLDSPEVIIVPRPYYEPEKVHTKPDWFQQIAGGDAQRLWQFMLVLPEVLAHYRRIHHPYSYSESVGIVIQALSNPDATDLYGIRQHFSQTEEYRQGFIRFCSGNGNAQYIKMWSEICRKVALERGYKLVESVHEATLTQLFRGFVVQSGFFYSLNRDNRFIPTYGNALPEQYLGKPSEIPLSPIG